MQRGAGMTVMLIGLGVVVIGLLIWSGALSWFGRLPGDLRFEGPRTRVFVPITSMVLVSLALTVLVNLVARMFR